MDRGDTWFFMPLGVPDGVTFQAAEAPDLIRKATGIDLPYEVLSSDEWVASSLLADKYRKGRVFLAGDACHLHPPMGGYGMNMGVADGVDLGWKLAAVLRGWGGEALLESYERERAPVHRFVIDEATSNHSVTGNQLMQPGLEDDTEEGARLRAEVGALAAATKLREFNTLGVMLGYRYNDSPVIVGDGSAEPANDFINYVPTSRPGHLAPHAWLHDGSSLYDHFGPSFTLLDNGQGAATDVAPAQRAAQEAGLPLTVICPKEPGLPALYPARFTLIRPDQHVAWRGDTWPEDGHGLLLRVAGRQRG